MNINSVIKKSKPTTVINPEGKQVYRERPDRDLFLSAISLKLNSKFYKDGNETLNDFISLYNDVKDPMFSLKVALFAHDLGIRLAPGLLNTLVAINCDAHMRQYIKYITLKIFDRPDKIANICEFFKYVTGASSFKKLPPYYKKALKRALENMKPITLKSFKLKRRTTKLSDLIKILRPKPRTEELSNLYKDIIENNSRASLKDEKLVSTISNNQLTREEKVTKIKAKLDSIPINSLIRNLRYLKDSDEVTLNKVIRRLEEVINTKSRIVNPFDVMKAGAALENEKIFNSIEKLPLNFHINNVDYLIDASGSMGGNEGTVSFLISLLHYYSPGNIWFFNTELLPGPFKLKNESLYKNYTDMFDIYKPEDGTALLDSIKKVQKKSNFKTLVVISDEVTWDDDEEFYGYRKHFQNDKSYIIINPTHYSFQTAFDPRLPNVFKLASIDAKILTYINAFAAWPKFRKEFIDSIDL